MKCDENEKSCVPEKEFANSTSLHGIAFWWSSKTTLQRAFWVILVLGMFCGLIQQCITRISAYYDYNTSTEVSRHFRASIKFPAITICNFNRLFNPESGEERRAMRLLNRVIFPGLPPNDSSVNTSALQFFNTPGFSANEYYMRKGYPLNNETLIQCSFEGIPCTADDFTPVLTTMGKCYTFNPNRKAPLYQSTPGTYGGFKLTLNALHWNYTEDPENGNLEAGIRFQIHEQNSTADVDGQGLAIPVGQAAYALMERKDITNMYHPWGVCFPELERSLTRDGHYSLETCYVECVALRVTTKCECVHFAFPQISTYPECSIEQMKNCSTPFLLRVLDEMELSDCPCPIPCNFTEYSVQLSYALFPNVNVRWTGQNAIDRAYIKDNYVSLNVAFSQLNVITEVQSKKVEESALLSDIGGQLGLWVGMSLITVFEFLQYLTFRTWKSCKSKPKPDESNPKENENGPEAL